MLTVPDPVDPPDEVVKNVVPIEVVAGVTVDELTVGDEVELVVDTLYTEDGCDYLVWKWRPLGATAPGQEA